MKGMQAAMIPRLISNLEALLAMESHVNSAHTNILAKALPIPTPSKLRISAKIRDLNRACHLQVISSADICQVNAVRTIVIAAVLKRYQLTVR